MGKQYTFCEVNSNKIIEIGYDENGKKFINTKNYKPTLAIIDYDSDSGWKTLHDEPVKLKKFDSISDMRDYKRMIGDLGDIDIYGDIQPQYQFISENYELKKFNFDIIKRFYFDIECYSENNTYTPDGIEDAIYPITAITIYSSITKLYYTFATKRYDPKQTILKNVTPEEIKFCYCENEEKLLMNFITFFRQQLPDTLQGWNSDQFDVPYIIQRISDIVSEADLKLLSPFKRVSNNTKTQNGRTINNPYIGGIALLDMMVLYKKYIFTPRESYALNFIASEELEDSKLDYSEEGDLNNLWDENPQKYIDYNIKDVKLLVDLDNKLSLTEIQCTLAYMVGGNLVDPLGTLRPWDIFLYNKFKERKIVIPPNKHNSKEVYPGAYVKQPIPGIYKWVISSDLNSLYPHIQQQYNISPECIVDTEPIANIKTKEFVEFDKNGDEVYKSINLDERFLKKEIIGDKKYILAANGHYFRKDIVGIIPTILRELYDERKAVKRSMLSHEQDMINAEKDSVDYYTFKTLVSQENNLQMAIKIFLNSEYGAIANRFFRYYDIRMATAITLGGQLAIRWIEKYLMEHDLQKKYKWESIYCDTDSDYFTLDKFVIALKQKFPNMNQTDIVDKIDEFCKKVLLKIIQVGYDDLAEYMNANENRMFMEREIIAESAVFISKKKYACRVWDSEGVRYKSPKLKVKGIEIVKSSTPKFVREALREALNLFLTDQVALKEFIKQQKKIFRTKSPEEIAFPRTANNIEKYRNVESDIPIQVRAALAYLDYKEKNNLTHLPNINSGEKLKFIYLKEPNPFFSNVVAFSGKWPFPDLRNFVNYVKMFEKTFISPLEIISKHTNIDIIETDQIDITSIF